MQVHQPKARGTVLLRIGERAGLLDAVLDVFRAAAPGPFGAVLVARDAIALAGRQFALGAEARDRPGERG